MSLLTYSFLLAVVGSLILLDKWALGELGGSQPIVSCPLLGLLFGDPGTGFFLGIALQLVWVEALPLGADRPLDYQSAGVVGVTGYLFASRAWLLSGVGDWAEVRGQVLFICLVLSGLATIFGQYTDDRLKHYNAGLYRAGMRARTRAGVTLIHLSALVFSFLRGLLVTGLFLVAVWAVLPFVSRLPDFTTHELLLIPLAIGIAGLVRLFQRRERIPYFLSGAAISGLLWVFGK